MAKEEISSGTDCTFSHFFLHTGEKHLHKRVYAFHFFPSLLCGNRPERNFPRFLSQKHMKQRTKLPGFLV